MDPDDILRETYQTFGENLKIPGILNVISDYFPSEEDLYRNRAYIFQDFYWKIGDSPDKAGRLTIIDETHSTLTGYTPEELSLPLWYGTFNLRTSKLPIKPYSEDKEITLGHPYEFTTLLDFLNELYNLHPTRQPFKHLGLVFTGLSSTYIEKVIRSNNGNIPYGWLLL